jgi:hypothetical protein
LISADDSLPDVVESASQNNGIQDSLKQTGKYLHFIVCICIVFSFRIITKTFHQMMLLNNLQNQTLTMKANRHPKATKVNINFMHLVASFVSTISNLHQMLSQKAPRAREEILLPPIQRKQQTQVRSISSTFLCN